MGRRLTDAERMQRTIPEADVQATVTDALTAHGWLWNHSADSRKSNPGLPDVVGVHGRTGCLVFLELKKQTGVVTVEQRAWLEAMYGDRWPADPCIIGRYVDDEAPRPFLIFGIVRPSNLDDTLAAIVAAGKTEGS